MAETLPLSCRCGTLQGHAAHVSRGTTKRMVCYCDDCQCFAHHLGAAETALDAGGGTELLLMAPGQLALEGELRCLRLSPKGPLRWYAACCRAPVANGLPSPGMPFASVVRTFVSSPDATLDATLGDARGLNGKFATGPTREGTSEGTPAALLLGVGTQLAKAKLRGWHRPSPFFEGKTPTSPPELISREERARLRAMVSGG
ncbi:MAG: DUF6151 family protein [Myxococcota bacterium]